MSKQEAEDRERGGVLDREKGLSRDPALTAANMKEKDEKREAGRVERGGGARTSTGTSADAMAVDEVEGKGKGKVVLAGDLIDEPTKRAEEAALLRSLIASQLKDQVGANMSALYELAALVTHKGASANGGKPILSPSCFMLFTSVICAGHYVGWSRVTSSTTEDDMTDPDKQEWYRYDDEKVTTVSRDRIMSLDGGGLSFLWSAKLES